MKSRDLFWAGFGLAALFLQLPMTKMILDDPQSLHLGIWNWPTFLLFSAITFGVIPLVLGLVLATLWKAYPKTCALLLAMGISFMVATQLNVHELKFRFPHASWRQPLFAGLLLLPVIPLVRFREPVIQVLKVCAVFGLGIFAFFTAHAAPTRLAAASASPAPSTLQTGAPIFFLTFEKVVASYVADEQGRILKDRFPNLARFAREADYYPRAYANSTATIYALKALYSGRAWTSERNWSVRPTLASILGPGRRTYMLLDVLTEYCRPPAVCLRTIGQEHLASRDLLIAWYTSYLNDILPDPIEARVVRALRLKRNFNTAWDLWGRETGDYIDVGRRQFERLKELVQAQGSAPNLYVMHNFISDFVTSGPGVTTSVLEGGPQSESGRLQELEAARDNLAAFDAGLGEFLDWLKTSGLYDRSLIFISADTGYDPFYRLVMGNDELTMNPDLVRIFLAIKRPRQQEGRTISAPIQQVDVLPTILHHLGIDPAPFHFDGIVVAGAEPAQELAQRPLNFSIASARAGILYYRLANPHGPLRRTDRF